MSKDYKDPSPEDQYIRAKLDEAAKSGRILESSDDVADYLDELDLGKAFSDYFERLPRQERRKIVDEHKKKYKDYHARPSLATTATRGPPPSDSAYGSRVSGPSGIERLRQADEDSECVNDSFEIYLIHQTAAGEVTKTMRARYDDRNSANFMCIETARDIFGPMTASGHDIPIHWRHMKDDSNVRRTTQCHLRVLSEKENEDVNVVFGSEVSRPGSTIGTDTPAIEDPALQKRRAKLREKIRARNAMMLLEQMTEYDMQEREGI